MQGLTAHSWYQGDETSVETIFSDMIESILGISGKRVRIATALRDATDRVTSVFNEYPGSAAWQYPMQEKKSTLPSGGVFGM